MAARRVELNGLGISLPGGRLEAHTILEMLGAVLADRTLKQRVRAFGGNHRSFRYEQATDQVIQTLTTIVRTDRTSERAA